MGLSNAQRQQRWREKRHAAMKLRPEVIERELVAAVERCGGLPEAERLALADKLSGAATDHLRRSNELLQLAWRVRFMVARDPASAGLFIPASSLEADRYFAFSPWPH